MQKYVFFVSFLGFGWEFRLSHPSPLLPPSPVFLFHTQHSPFPTSLKPGPPSSHNRPIDHLTTLIESRIHYLIIIPVNPFRYPGDNIQDNWDQFGTVGTIISKGHQVGSCHFPVNVIFFSLPGFIVKDIAHLRAANHSFEGGKFRRFGRGRNSNSAMPEQFLRSLFYA